MGITETWPAGPNWGFNKTKGIGDFEIRKRFYQEPCVQRLNLPQMNRDPLPASYCVVCRLKLKKPHAKEIEIRSNAISPETGTKIFWQRNRTNKKQTRCEAIKDKDARPKRGRLAENGCTDTYADQQLGWLPGREVDKHIQVLHYFGCCNSTNQPWWDVARIGLLDRSKEWSWVEVK